MKDEKDSVKRSMSGRQIPEFRCSGHKRTSDQRGPVLIAIDSERVCIF